MEIVIGVILGDRKSHLPGLLVTGSPFAYTKTPNKQFISETLDNNTIEETTKWYLKTTTEASTMLVPPGGGASVKEGPSMYTVQIIMDDNSHRVHTHPPTLSLNLQLNTTKEKTKSYLYLKKKESRDINHIKSRFVCIFIDDIAKSKTILKYYYAPRYCTDRAILIPRW